MPTVTLNRDVFESLLGKKIPVEQLKQHIAMIGTALENITDKEIVVEVFPNRPDMLNEQGFARALRSYLGIKTGLATYPIKSSGCKVIVHPSVTMRPYTACAIVKNLNFDDERIREVMQVQEKLATTHGRNRKKSAYGIYPLDTITFPITYKALDPTDVTFQPLGFDKPMKAAHVLEQHPKGKAYAHLTKDWKKFPFFIDAKGQVLCMLPFTNSHTTGKITESTHDVFIECTGTDENNVSVALNIIATMLADMGGTLYSIDVHYHKGKKTTPDLTPHDMTLDVEYVNKLLGLSLSQKEALQLLHQMGYGTSKNKVLVPAYRADILHPVDLVEDIAIAYGFDKFKGEIPRVATIAEENVLERFKIQLLELLIGASFQETRSYHLMGHEQLTLMMNTTTPIIHLKNALVDYGCLRNSIIPSLLNILQRNQHYDNPQLLMEIGTTFHADKKAEHGIKETTSLALAMCDEKADFTKIRQIIDLIGRSLGISLNISEISHSSFIDGRTAHTEGMLFGELHPKVLTQWNMQTPVAAAEIDVDALFELVRAKAILKS